MQLILIGLFGANTALAQADPSWLRSWDEAWESRPVALASSGSIASESEPGVPFQIRGQVLRPDGRAASNVIVHAYHRDNEGFDFGEGDRASSTWRLQGWAKTNETGHFDFTSIRPGPDHLGREGAHIHFTLVSEEFGRQWAPKVFLADDPMVTDRQRSRSAAAGDLGWVRGVTRQGKGQQIEVKFRLREKADF